MINEFRPMNHLTSLQNFICTIGNLPTSYALSLSYEEQIWWLCDFLEKKVFPAIEENTNITEETQKAFIELQNYVRDYFNNLDVQEEINNKLDEMTESGVLENILMNYINVTKVYDTTVEMLNDNNLKNNMKVKTLGYYEVNDGGGAEFIISNEINSIYLQFELINGLYANLLIKNDTINFKSLGARSFDENFNKVDSKSFLLKYINFIKNNKFMTLKLFIPSGVFFFSETNLQVDNLYIYGIEQFKLYEMSGSVIAPLNNNQNYIWLVGSTENIITKNINLKNLFFTGYNITHSFEKYYNINIENIFNCNSLLKISKCFGGFTDNLIFMFLKGKALEITSSYEIYFKLLNFRHCQNINGCILNFADFLYGNDNITACNFEKIMFEAIHGNLINVEKNARFSNNFFGVINVEDYPYLYGNNGEYIALNSENANYNDLTATHHSVINIEENAQFECEINSIELNNFAYYYYLYNNTQYIYDTIIKTNYSNYISLIINNINFSGLLKNPRIIKHNNEFMSIIAKIIINNVSSDSLRYKPYCDVNNFSNLIVNNIIDCLIGKIKNNYNNFADYRTNNEQLINWKYRGNLKFEENSLAKNNFVVSLINPVTYPSTDRVETIIPVTSKKLHFRAKLPSSEGTISLGTQIKNRKTNTVLATKNVNAQGNGNFEWYTIDYSDVIDDTNIGDLVITFYPNDNYDFNIELDVFFFE